MTHYAIIFSVFLLIVVPGALWSYFGEKKSGKSFLLALLISGAGMFVSLFLFDEWNIFPEYQDTRKLIIVAITLATPFLSMLPSYYEDSEEAAGFGVIVLFILFIGSLVFIPYTYMSEKEAACNTKVEVATCVRTENIEILSLNSGIGVEGRSYVSGNWLAVVGSGYVDNEPIYFYYHRNEKGAIIRSYVPSDEEITEIYDILGDSEQAYLQIVNTVEVKTDNNYSPAKVTEKVVDTKYHFYVPKNSIPVEFEFNLN